MRTPEQERERKRLVAARWRAANPDEAKRRRAQWRATNQEHIKAYRQAYWRRDLEASRARDRARREQYAERKKATLAAWKRENRGRLAELQARSRARARGNEWEPIDRDAVFERDGGICHLCGGLVDPASWHLDHIQPLSKGGGHLLANVAVTHPFCNLSKHDREVA
jgi:5-methylcytosine-specific restriction endonuclease McrA